MTLRKRFLFLLHRLLTPVNERHSEDPVSADRQLDGVRPTRVECGSVWAWYHLGVDPDDDGGFGRDHMDPHQLGDRWTLVGLASRAGHVQRVVTVDQPGRY